MNLLKKLIGIPFTVLITSLYYFPIQVRWFPAINSKMALASVGLGLFLINIVKERTASIKKEILVAGAFALIVSLVGIISTTYNNTNDYAYASYIVSYLVWVFGAYTVITIIKSTHNEINTNIIVNYLSTVCVIQCITALLIDSIPSVQRFVDSWLVGFGFTSLDNVKEIGRMYGIGATLDVAGARFCPILISIAISIRHLEEDGNSKYLWLYILSFLFISIIGNMMGRTTTLGMALGVIIILFPRQFSSTIDKDTNRIIGTFFGLLLATTIISLILYNTSPIFRNNLRFGFEGFFSLFEKGEWHTTSNDRLVNMIVFPESLKTWVIGDGYFEGAANDLNFLGDSSMSSYYMWTDIGYLRFIFYFGVVGLLAFSSFFFYCGYCCFHIDSQLKWLFIFVVLLNFLIWLKVSTDSFLFFAPFLWLDARSNKQINGSSPNSSET